MADVALLHGAVEVPIRDRVIRLPNAFLRPFVDGGVMTVWLDGCVALWPAASWRDLANRIAGLPMTADDARTFARVLFGSAEGFGSASKVELTPSLVDIARLTDRVQVVGVGDHAELWAPGRWVEVTRRPLETLALPVPV